MNKALVEKLAVQSLVWVDTGLADGREQVFSTSVFAELIVRECAGIAYEYDIPNLTGPGEFIGNRMKKHFGVEE